MATTLKTIHQVCELFNDFTNDKNEEDCFILLFGACIDLVSQARYFKNKNIDFTALAELRQRFVDIAVERQLNIIPGVKLDPTNPLGPFHPVEDNE